MRRILSVVVILCAAGLIWFFLQPAPVPVDLGRATRGNMHLTVREDGRTRIREKYVVSTPLAGRLTRIDLEPGDPVVAGETQLAIIEPTDPELLDPRALAEGRARVQAAEARLAQLEPALKLSEEALHYAETEVSRIRQLHQKNAAPQQLLDQTELSFDTARAEYSRTMFAREIAEYELQLARAALIHTAEPTADTENPAPFQFPIRAPITGRVLRVLQESSTVVAAGAPLLELGDPSDLEIEVDVLSTDAVRIRPGASVFLEQWGGDHPLPARVRLVEPSAFTKISALGVEEQRVFVIADFEDPSDIARQPGTHGLGDGYRVDARIVVWSGQAVLKVPVAALFRQGDDWCVFRRIDNRARTTVIRTGHRNDLEAEVVGGLQEGDEVVLHPGDRIQEGSRLQPRESGPEWQK